MTTSERGSSIGEGESSTEERIRRLEERLTGVEEVLAKIWCNECKVAVGTTFSDTDLRRLIETGRIKITPLPNLDDGKVLGTCKVDLRLGEKIKTIDAWKITSVDLVRPIPEEYFREVNLREFGELVVHPGELIIATTLEHLVLPDDIIGEILGKSSVARRGISVQAAPLFDAGWIGNAALELHCIGKVPVPVRYGEPICAMKFTHLSSPTSKGYAAREGSLFANQDKPIL